VIGIWVNIVTSARLWSKPSPKAECQE